MPGRTRPEPRPIGRRVLGWARDLALAFVLFGVGTMLVGSLRAPNVDPEPYAFSGVTTEGQPLSLSDYEGQWLVLNFWATWCGPCLHEMPAFSTFAVNNPEIAVVGVTADGSRGKIKALGKKLGVTYPLLLPDPAHNYAYEVDAYPTTVFINPEGEVDRVHVGSLWRAHLWWFTR